MKEIITIEIDTGKSAQTLKELQALLEKQNKNLETTAKGSDKFKKLQKGIKETEKEIKLLTKGVEKYTHSDKARDKQMAKADKTIKQNTKSIVRLKVANTNLTHENKILKKSYDAGQISFEKYSKRVVENTSKLDKNKIEVGNLTIQNRALLKTQEAIPSSMKEMGLQLSNLKSKYKSLTDEERKSPIGQEMLKNIKTLDVEIKDLDNSIGNSQRNVGNYPNVLGKAGSSMKNLGGSIMKMAGALGLAVGASKLFSAGFDAMKRNSQAFGDSIKETMEGAKEGTDAFFRSIMNGDWSNLLDNMEEAYNAGVQYAKIMDLLKDKNRARQYEIIKIEGQIAKEMTKLYTKGLGAKERKKALDNIEKLELQKLDKKKEMITEEINIEADKIEDTINLGREEVKSILTNTKEIEKMERLSNKKKIFDNRQKKEEDANAAEMSYTALEEHLAKRKAAFVKGLSSEEKINLQYVESFNNIDDKKRDNMVKLYGDLEKVQQDYDKTLKTLAEQANNVNNMAAAEDKEIVDKTNDSRQKEIDFQKELLRLSIEKRGLTTDDDEFELRREELEKTWKLEKQLLKKGSNEYIVAEKTKNNALLALENEYSESVKVLAQQDFEDSMKYLNLQFQEEELLLKQAYANNTEYLGEKIVSEEAYNEQLTQIKQAQLLSEIAMLKDDILKKEELKAKELELENFVADEKIRLNKKVLDAEAKAEKESWDKTMDKAKDAMAMAQQSTELLAGLMSGNEDAMKQFLKGSLTMMLDVLEKQVLMATTWATIQSLSSAESVATFGVAGIIKAGIMAGLIKGAFAGIRAKIMSFNEGGSVPGNGNTDTVSAILTPGEFVLRKNAMQSNQTFSVSGTPREIASGLNSNFGGRGYNLGGAVQANETLKMETAMLNQNALINALKEMPAPIVMVEEISTKLVDDINNKKVAII